jgi:hypothetical protein
MSNWPAVTARQTCRPCGTRLQRAASNLLSASNSLNIARDVNAACASLGQERFYASGVLHGTEREQFLIRGRPWCGRDRHVRNRELNGQHLRAGEAGQVTSACLKATYRQ